MTEGSLEDHWKITAGEPNEQASGPGAARPGDDEPRDLVRAR